MAAVYYEGGANCAIMAFAAIRYDDRVYGQDTDSEGNPLEDREGNPVMKVDSGENKWILSDNYVPYIYYAQ